MSNGSTAATATLIVLPETGQEQAVRVAERPRRMVAPLKLPLGNGDDLKFTISLDVTQFESEDKLEAFVDRADQGLYGSKEAGGGNRVTAR